MTEQITVLGISGSLRRASYNTALLHACRQEAPHDVKVEVRRLHDVPLFDRDVEARGYPASVMGLRDAIAGSDGVLLASPEYNRSISGVLKNAIDWASRGKDSPLNDKPTALLSSAGRGGGRSAQAHLREVLRHNAVDVLEPAVGIARGWDHFEDGRLVADDHRREVRELVAALRVRILERRDAID